MLPKATNLFGCAAHLIPLILTLTHPSVAKATEDKPGGAAGTYATTRPTITNVAS